MYLLVIFLPLLASLFTGICGRFLGFRGAAVVTTSCVLISSVCSLGLFYEIALLGSPCSVEWSPWFVCEFFDASWGFYFDSLTACMLLVVTSVSLCVHVYSISYMGEDPHLPRFMSTLSLFTFFMLMLVTADNFLQLFFGWEGVGLASYLLISFWFTRLQASKASLKAMLVNRVGDFGLALGIMALFSLCKSVDFSTVFACAPLLAESVLIFCTREFHALDSICLLLFIGAVGKSAQLGLHTWLPDAMEGPTPVSALIHAATMVTAGVFLIARCSPLFEYAPKAGIVVCFLGAITCFFAATTAVVQNDLKRVIAYSTASQLGYMVFACGLSQYGVGIFHLLNHAFFKALLFLSAGSVIHALADQQDIRKMGGVAQVLPFTYAMMSVGSLALVGFPFLTGFYSKDVILEVSYAKYTWSGNLTYFFGSLCVLLTSYYSFRLLFLTFLSPTACRHSSLKGLHEANLLMALPLMVLACGSIFVGYLAKDLMIGWGTPFWSNAIFVLPKNSSLLESEWIPQTHKWMPLWCTLGGAVSAYLFTMMGFKSPLSPSKGFPYSSKEEGTLSTRQPLYRVSRVQLLCTRFLAKRWFFDKVYNDFVSENALRFGYSISLKTLDKGCFEVLGPTGLASTFGNLAKYVTKIQSGLIYHYAVVMLLGLCFFISLISLWEFVELVLDAPLFFLYLLSFVFFNSDALRS